MVTDHTFHHMQSLTRHIDRLNAMLRTNRCGRACRWFDTVDSTNSEALSWARHGAAAGSLVVADFQKQGRGRFKRSWTADPGRNLTFSLVLDADEVRARLELLPIALAVATAETLGEIVAPHQPLIKWPNDVLLAGRKVCGILIESSLPSHSDRRGGYVVAGIGINVNQEKFPAEITEVATSIFQVLGRQTDRVLLLSEILLSIESVLAETATGATQALRDRYEARMAGIGKTVRFSYIDRDRATEGTLLGIDDAGGLRIRTQDGIQTLRAGEVTLREDRRGHSVIARVSDQSRPASSS